MSSESSGTISIDLADWSLYNNARLIGNITRTNPSGTLNISLKLTDPKVRGATGLKKIETIEKKLEQNDLNFSFEKQ
jgi:hypothetical protein